MLVFGLKGRINLWKIIFNLWKIFSATQGLALLDEGASPVLALATLEAYWHAVGGGRATEADGDPANDDAYSAAVGAI